MRISMMQATAEQSNDTRSGEQGLWDTAERDQCSSWLLLSWPLAAEQRTTQPGRRPHRRKRPALVVEIQLPRTRWRPHTRTRCGPTLKDHAASRTKVLDAPSTDG